MGNSENQDNKDLIQVYIKSISASQQNNQYRIIELGETNGKRVMRVVLGMFEAELIAAALGNRIFKRPMPYQVLNDVIKLYHIELREVVIFGAKDKVIFSKLVLEQDTNKQELTVRISDALALAVETGSPIFVERYIVEEFFRNLAENPQEVLVNKLPIEAMSISELEDELNRVVEIEDYEEAAKIRDEIAKRNVSEQSQTKDNNSFNQNTNNKDEI